MTSVRGRLLVAALLALGLAPIAFLGVGGSSRSLGGDQPAFLWPWCADGSPPPAAAREYPADVDFPDPYTEGDWFGPYLGAEPMGDVVVLATALGDLPTLISPRPQYLPHHSDGPFGWLDVRIERVLDDGVFGSAEAGVLKDGSVVRVTAEKRLLDEIVEASEAGPVFLAVNPDLLSEKDLLLIGGAVDVRLGEVLGQPSGESIVEEFMVAQGALDEDPRIALLVEWNAEYVQFAAPEDGPVTSAYADLLAEFVPPEIDIPRPGTMAYWDAAPPECRSMMDAPPKVLETLKGVSISVRIPDVIAKAEDAAICVRSDYGGMGCTVMRPDPDADVVEFEGYRDPAGGPIVIQLARMVNDAPLWLDRTTLVTIPDADLFDGVQPTIELPESLAGDTYDRIVASMESSTSA